MTPLDRIREFLIHGKTLQEAARAVGVTTHDADRALWAALDHSELSEIRANRFLELQREEW